MEEFALSGEARRTLLELARKALEQGAKEYPKRAAVWRGGENFIERIVESVTAGVKASAELRRQNGVFVTLRKEGALRGCIGTFSSQQPLYKTVPEYTLQSAFFDPRFPPVAPQEVASVRIEVSVLSPLRPARPEEIEVGKHGIYIRRGGRSGCYLPEVATDYGMSREEFLSSCCTHKAGLPADAWRQKDTEILIFTTFKFSEPR
ncbi:MAG: hypothetical protein DRP82_04255 [Planctomycetota bacterium]|nr:MAG: hypothetical protein DRP82_04255 [Planctomycetota bacterium]